MSGALAQQIPFESRRVPLERRITLKFEHREGFVNEYAANVSLKGMFITAWVPEPCGSAFLFEVQVTDRQRLIHGVGEVVWVREEEESSERPSGMGVRFLKLDDASREVIDSMVAAHVRQGGKPFDLADGPGGIAEVDRLFDDDAGPEAAGEGQASRAGGPVATLRPEFRPEPLEGRAMVRRRWRGLALFWLTLAGLIAGSVLVLLLI